MNVRNNTISYLTKGGLLTALGVIFVYMSTIIPINKLYLLAVASSIIPIAVMATNIKNAIIVYVATDLLSFLLCGIKVSVILYVVFFGLYGILKYYVENLGKIHIEIILKFVFFNIILFILLYIYKVLFVDIVNANMPIYIFIIGCEIFFLVYDYVLTLFINYAKKFFNKLN